MQLFRINLKTVALTEDINWEKLVEITDGYSGADLANVCREAALMPLRRKLLQSGGFNMGALEEMKEKEALKKVMNRVISVNLDSHRM